VRPGVILFIDTNTNFLFRADHEQLRYEDSVLAQGALIKVQQGFGKHMATKIARAWNRSNRIACWLKQKILSKKRG
jgi:hypothetical protein